MTKDIFEVSLREFIDTTASDSPTPGGGSVSAVVGALGSALVQMVGNLTVGKEKYKGVEGEVKELLDKSSKIMNELKELTRKDIEHFDAFIKVLSMPKDTEEQKQKRSEAIQKTLKEAANTPLSVARLGVEMLAIVNRMAEIGSKMVISDAGVAAHLIEASIYSALITVDSNLVLIKDEKFINNVDKEKKELQEKAVHLREKTVEAMRKKMEN
ncbi:cyclodeaminase/cyclohydrolase family protein [Peptococcaceae bacterium]|nr:cyclodeaminase/cyclohydrolase family protein [Peptococcaceae bacterium]MCL0051887.1 cyclodeaminase/cyclohydrolase family protein [Peptococcaceae bacterium]MCL0062999.1 cyclodeaminase/cyclohydrolase family protein [Peptococcaceae bacterium]MCL0071628.1 cyclodeaminase/cyclohydrolase family protein [Peptococcaceae bacterium]MCL0077717.1 cyclodeaminase/cyclohydrolase family protein [Peptococcaceae bacterium]